MKSQLSHGLYLPLKNTSYYNSKVIKKFFSPGFEIVLGLDLPWAAIFHSLLVEKRSNSVFVIHQKSI